MDEPASQTATYTNRSTKHAHQMRLSWIMFTCGCLAYGVLFAGIVTTTSAKIMIGVFGIPFSLMFLVFAASWTITLNSAKGTYAITIGYGKLSHSFAGTLNEQVKVGVGLAYSSDTERFIIYLKFAQPLNQWRFAIESYADYDQVCARVDDLVAKLNITVDSSPTRSQAHPISPNWPEELSYSDLSTTGPPTRLGRKISLIFCGILALAPFFLPVIPNFDPAPHDEWSYPLMTVMCWIFVLLGLWDVSPWILQLNLRNQTYVYRRGYGIFAYTFHGTFSQIDGVVVQISFAPVNVVKISVRLRVGKAIRRLRVEEVAHRDQALERAQVIASLLKTEVVDCDGSLPAVFPFLGDSITFTESGTLRERNLSRRAQQVKYPLLVLPAAVIIGCLLSHKFRSP